MDLPASLLQQINRLAPSHHSLRIMNVCGGHERTLSQAGIRSLLPDTLHLIPGPGCPVCVCPEEDIYAAIQLARHENITLLAFGDMLRVPIHAAKADIRTLDEARAQGADVHPVASPQDVINLAKGCRKEVVFFAAGFETTMAPIAAMLAAGLPDNLSVLLSGRRTWPAVHKLLALADDSLDALIAPGHVATVMGSDEWRFVVDQYHRPTAVAGFTPLSMLQAIHSVLLQWHTKQPQLENCYREAVTTTGNLYARQLIEQTLSLNDAHWRGIGTIAASGFDLRAAYQQHDARLRFHHLLDDTRDKILEMPAGCDCAAVLLGQCQPNACRLYGKACTPQSPIGPCMVSDEGACHIWWQSGIRHHDQPAATTVAQA